MESGETPGRRLRDPEQETLLRGAQAAKYMASFYAEIGKGVLRLNECI